MSWKAVLGRQASECFVRPDAQPALDRGTLMLELDLSDVSARQDILHMPWGHVTLRMFFKSEERVGLTIGDRSTFLDLGIQPGLETLRLSFAWDCARGWAELAQDRSETASILAVPASIPPSLPWQNVTRNRAITLADGVVYVAISDDVEPLGPAPAITAGTPVTTAHGLIPVEALRCGDLVMTTSGDLVPVLYKTARRVPTRGRFAPYRLRAPYLELKHDIIVGGDQHIEMRGSDVEYTFGKEAVFVAAKSLANGYAARLEPTGPFVTYHQIVLPTHDSILVAGAALESLYVGRLRRHAGQLTRSILRKAHRNQLPEHAGIRHPALRRFDTIALLDQRAA